MIEKELKFCRENYPQGCWVIGCPRNREKLEKKNMTSKTPVWIVVSSEGAASNPMTHTNYTSACIEARRLARLKPGVYFHVYQRVLTVRQEEKPLTETTYGVEDMPF